MLCLDTTWLCLDTTFESEGYMDAQQDDISGKGDLWPHDEGKPPVTVLIQPRNRQYQVQWIPLWQDVETGVSIMEQAKMDKPLSQTEYRVRDMLLGSIHIGNWAIVNQAELARQLRVQRADVSRAISRLIELGIVLRGEKIGRNSQYMISPGFAFKGGLAEGQRSVKKAQKDHKSKVLQFPKVRAEQVELPV